MIVEIVLVVTACDFCREHLWEGRPFLTTVLHAINECFEHMGLRRPGMVALPTLIIRDLA
jgi:hypothetical protein